VHQAQTKPSTNPNSKDCSVAAERNQQVGQVSTSPQEGSQQHRFGTAKHLAIRNQD